MKIEKNTHYGDKEITEMLEVQTLPDGKLVLVVQKTSMKKGGQRMHRDVVTLVLSNADREEVREALKKP